MTNVHGLWYVASAICFLVSPSNEPIETKTFLPPTVRFHMGAFALSA